MSLLLVVAVVCLVGVEAAHTGSKLPPWITPCYRDDPAFNQCAIKQGQALIPRVVKGERKIRLPAMDPLEIVEIQLEKSVTNLGLDITLRNISIYGLANTVITDFQAYFKDQAYSLTLFVPTLEIISTYNVSGKILVLPITGAGRGNITLKNVYATFSLSFFLNNNPKDGKDYMALKDYNLDFNTTRVYVQLDNLFNGDKLLGSTMNSFMNDNWKELVANIGPVISSALGELLVNIFNVIGAVIPYDDILPLSPKT